MRNDDVAALMDGRRAVAVGVWERWKRESVVMVFGIVARER